MTIKHLTGTYTSGYALKGKYSGLVIEATAYVGGSGVSAARYVSVTNFGSIVAASTADGIDLSAGGKVTNGSTVATNALILGNIGVRVSAAPGAVANFGTIEGRYKPHYSGGPYRGVNLSAGGEVTNGSSSDTSALIEGGLGVYVGGAAGTVTNYGSILAINATGIQLNAGGEVINGSASDVTATVSGSMKYNSNVGVKISNDPGTVLNFGTIQVGVYLQSGQLVNGSNLDISSTIDGHVEFRGTATISNFGTIQGAYEGISLYNAQVVNGSNSDTSSLIEGTRGISDRGVSTINNYGTIMGTGSESGSYGVFVYGGILINGSTTDTTAFIEGYDGIHIRVPRGVTITISNYGTITGSGGQYSHGIYMYGGVVTNGSAGDTTALIEGYVGVRSRNLYTGGITLTNFGTIEGTGGVAVHFQYADSLLVVEGGSVFDGVVEGGGGALNLASGKGNIVTMGGGDITVSDRGRASNFTDFADITISKGAQFTLTGFGAIAATGESLRVNGLLAVSGELLVRGRLDGTGTVAIRAGGLAQFDAPTASILTLAFRGSDAELALAYPYSFGAVISGFAATDTIDLLNTAATSAVLGAGDTLVITNGSNAVATLQLSGNYANDTFSTASDGKGGTNITISTGASTTPPAAPPPPHALIAAAASLGAGLGGAYGLIAPRHGYGRLGLAAPHVQMV